MIGLTDEILSAIEGRQKKKENEQRATELYQAVSTMKDFHLSPTEWRQLPRLDRKILIYSRIMEQHYLDTVHEEQKRKMDAERRQRDFVSNLPKQVLPRRR